MSDFTGMQKKGTVPKKSICWGSLMSDLDGTLNIDLLLWDELRF